MLGKGSLAVCNGTPHSFGKPYYHIPPLQCEGNEYIMECLVLMDNYGNADLICINHCWIHKQVLTMSDIKCGNGVYLCCDAHTFIPMLQPPSKYDWANKWPSHSDWNLWWAAPKILTSQNLLLPFFDCLVAGPSLPTLPANGTTLLLPGASTNHSLVATTAMLYEQTTTMLASSSENTPLHHSLPIPASLPHILTGGAMPS